MTLPHHSAARANVWQVSTEPLLCLRAQANAVTVRLSESRLQLSLDEACNIGSSLTVMTLRQQKNDWQRAHFTPSPRRPISSRSSARLRQRNYSQKS